MLHRPGVVLVLLMALSSAFVVSVQAAPRVAPAGLSSPPSRHYLPAVRSSPSSASPTPQPEPWLFFTRAILQKCEPNAGLTYVEGTVYKEGQPTSGYRVVYSDAPDGPIIASTLAGPHAGYEGWRTGFYSHILQADGPREGNWFFWIVNESGKRISAIANVRTDGRAGDGKCQQAVIDFDTADFQVREVRLWDVVENGGSVNNGSVTCGEKRELHVIVLDAHGNPLNGVTVQAEYGAQETLVTGAQGQGDGQAQFILGRSQALKVVRDADGWRASSETATGMSTDPADIPYEQLIAARYCEDEADCKAFVDMPGCWGHYSWTVTFQGRR